MAFCDSNGLENVILRLSESLSTELASSHLLSLAITTHFGEKCK